VKQLVPWTLVGVLLAAAVPARAGEVKVSFTNGRVTLVATDASPREILGEWARLGQVRVTNLDRLTGTPVTLQLTDVPETRALETILRGTAGYVAAPRREPVSTISRYDRILLMPGVAPTVTAAAPRSQPPAGAGVGRGRPGQPPFTSFGTDRAGAGGPMSRFTQSWMTRDAGQSDPSGPAMQRPGLQSFVVAEPVLNDEAQEQTGAVPTSSQVPGVPVGQPGQAAGSAARPGEVTGTTATAPLNPYGPQNQMQAPVTNPAASPYGLPNTAAKPPAQTPVGPIKVPE
jgi:hypothetical protein